ncbi:hypothetical protein [Roseibium marinum]|uniref:Uncharacterized protein n=1 Tax=Roseibium marinum TaxID=281252 RepID=A0A2S3UNP6_9HYPH|nr:hypothetical protein [Roseibium marinum]POF29200.1 hypothetical protein CLV41_110204 [Roseibium marinum]
MRAVQCIATLLLTVAPGYFQSSAAAAEIRHFLYTSAGDFDHVKSRLENRELAGVQVLFNWKMLEPEKDRYDFSGVEKALAEAESHDKKFFLQVQDRFFLESARYVPAYILEGSEFGGGLARQVDDSEAASPKPEGWVTMQWVPAVRIRFQALLTALAEQFDGRIEGINLPESSMDIDRNKNVSGFTCEAYFEATLENLTHARKVFRKSLVVQYVNFWPCEWNNSEGYMERAFEAAMEIDAGLGGPDIVPFRKGQMKNSYPFFHDYRDKLPVIAMAIQEPTLKYRNPETGKPFSRQEFIDFARDYLGVDIIFWSAAAPWLN